MLSGAAHGAGFLALGTLPFTIFTLTRAVLLVVDAGTRSMIGVLQNAIGAKDQLIHATKAAQQEQHHVLAAVRASIAPAAPASSLRPCARSHIRVPALSSLGLCSLGFAHTQQQRARQERRPALSTRSRTRSTCSTGVRLTPR